jgi:hypothetical protein
MRQASASAVPSVQAAPRSFSNTLKTYTVLIWIWMSRSPHGAACGTSQKRSRARRHRSTERTLPAGVKARKRVACRSSASPEFSIQGSRRETDRSST